MNLGLTHWDAPTPLIPGFPQRLPFKVEEKEVLSLLPTRHSIHQPWTLDIKANRGAAEEMHAVDSTPRKQQDVWRKRLAPMVLQLM